MNSKPIPVPQGDGSPCTVAEWMSQNQRLNDVTHCRIARAWRRVRARLLLLLRRRGRATRGTRRRGARCLLLTYCILSYCILTAYLLLTYCILTAYSYLIKDYSLLVHSSLLQNEILGTQIEDFKEASEERRILSPVPASRNILAVCEVFPANPRQFACSFPHFQGWWKRYSSSKKLSFDVQGH